MKPQQLFTVAVSCAALCNALDVSVPMPLTGIFELPNQQQEHDQDRNVRLLVDENVNSQCYNQTETMGKNIRDRAAPPNVHIQCTNSNYCETDARNVGGYDEYLSNCQELGGQEYIYHLQCDSTVEATDFYTVVTLRWNNMASCYGPVCTTDEVVELLHEGVSSFTPTESTGGARITKMVCRLEDITNSNGTVVRDMVDVDVDIASSAMPRSLVTAASLIAIVVSVLALAP